MAPWNGPNEEFCLISVTCVFQYQEYVYAKVELQCWNSFAKSYKNIRFRFRVYIRIVC